MNPHIRQLLASSQFKMMKIRMLNKYCAALVLSLSPLLSVAQVCQLPLERSAPDERFQIDVTEPGIVVDLQTGLTWQRCIAGFELDYANTTTISDDTCTVIDEDLDGVADPDIAVLYSWDEALAFAESLGGGWRVPNIKELASLVEYACILPSINGNVFPNAGQIDHWSSTPDTFDDSSVWVISFGSGDDGTNPKNQDSPVYLVRD